MSESISCNDSEDHASRAVIAAVGNEWQEPHPGAPLTLSLTEQETQYDGDRGTTISLGSERGDVAAKGVGLGIQSHPQLAGRPWLGGRQGRSKTRKKSLFRPLATSAYVPSPGPRACVTSSAVLPSQNYSGLMVPMGLRYPPPPASFVVEPSLLSCREKDCESVVSSTASLAPFADDATTIRSLDTCTRTSSPLHFTDYSNHLDMDIMVDGVDGDDGSMTVVDIDSDAFSHAATEDDMYGWEAELERKGSNSTSGSESCRFREKNERSKREIFQRVFSLGSRTNGLHDTSKRSSMATITTYLAQGRETRTGYDGF